MQYADADAFVYKNHRWLFFCGIAEVDETLPNYYLRHMQTVSTLYAKAHVARYTRISVKTRFSLHVSTGSGITRSRVNRRRKIANEDVGSQRLLQKAQACARIGMH